MYGSLAHHSSLVSSFASSHLSPVKNTLSSSHSIFLIRFFCQKPCKIGSCLWASLSTKPTWAKSWARPLMSVDSSSYSADFPLRHIFLKQMLSMSADTSPIGRAIVLPGTETLAPWWTVSGRASRCHRLCRSVVLMSLPQCVGFLMWPPVQLLSSFESFLRHSCGCPHQSDLFLGLCAQVNTIVPVLVVLGRDDVSACLGPWRCLIAFLHTKHSGIGAVGSKRKITFTALPRGSQFLIYFLFFYHHS